MKFTLSKNKQPVLGETRVKSWFAIWPVWIGNEVIWLERVTVLQEYSAFVDIDVEGISTEYSWKNMKFM